MRQDGFLMISAVTLIVIFGIISTFLITVFVTSTNLSLRLQAIQKASVLAESGLDQGRTQLTNPVIANRQSCGHLAGTLALSTGEFVVGKATDPTNAINPRYAFATLNTLIPSSSVPTTITVNNASVFAAHGGRILIDQEAFQYTGVLDGMTLSGVTRAEDGSSSGAHPVGTLVSQYQCTMSSTGNAPASNPLSSRTYQRGIQQPTLWAVGTGSILQWNTPTSELGWTSVVSPTSLAIFSISALNYHLAWAGSARNPNAKVTNGTYGLIGLNGALWSVASTPSAPKNSGILTGIKTVSQRDAWAVGPEYDGSHFSILHYSGGSWCLLANSNNGTCGGTYYLAADVYPGGQDLSDVDVVDTDGDGVGDFGFAVGGRSSGSVRTHLLNFVTPRWSKAVLSLPRVRRLNGVKVINNGNSTPIEGWAVGESLNAGKGKIIQWRTGTWRDLIETTAIMTKIDMFGSGTATFGLAVGYGGVAYLYNGSAWSATSLGTSNTLTDVVVLTASDAWVVDASGNRYHYDGASWSLSNTGATSTGLNAISAIFPANTPTSAWYDAIH